MQSTPNELSSLSLPPVCSVLLLTAKALRIFLVGDVFHPLDMLAVERLLHRDMHHAGVRAGAVPVFLARRDPHRGAGLDLADRSALRPHAPQDRKSTRLNSSHTD